MQFVNFKSFKIRRDSQITMCTLGKLASDSRDDETTKDKSVTCYEYKILCGPKHENSKYQLWAFSSSGSICSKSVYRYPLDKSLSTVKRNIGFSNSYLPDSGQS